MSEETLLRLPEVERLTGLKSSTIYEKMAEGQFPTSVRITGRTVAWVHSEISDWIRERIEKSRSGESGAEAV